MSLTNTNYENWRFSQIRKRNDTNQSNCNYVYV